MSTGLLMLVTVIYAGICMSEIINGRFGFAAVFFGYTMANCGMIWEMVK